ncbi:guanylate kinase [Paucilactobacillus hokkaidonensis JCM 18461]|uniref:Guanylate kinase n=2 Tax=Paucilactobacillus hokkaidonensis TaxID=1193095 RepID=A0A0A1H144_9LACO|nr:guanylate kinase [Paucilactobacillus hokkaidonensis JCM 18461]
MKRVLVITGATGAGKTTVSNYLEEKYDMPKVITHTTRAPRPGETDDVDYHFETKSSMEQLHLLEKVEYDHHQYGSSYEALDQAWEKNSLITIVLDTKGAQTYYEQLGEKAVIIFLTVSHSKSLVSRLTRRGDQISALEQRIKSEEYQRDLQLPKSLNNVAHLIVNDHWEETKEKLDKLVASLSNEVK